MTRHTRLLLLSALLYACGSGDDTMQGIGPSSADGAVESPDADGGSLADAAMEGGPRLERDGAVRERPPSCGNGQVEAREECDDQNQTDGDGCDQTCLREMGFNCPVAGGACDSVCGDQLLVAGEDCDDGNSLPDDGCDQACRVEPGWSCLTSGAPCVAGACGDGVVAGGESCDDGNQTPGDGCGVSCAVERGWLCSVQGAPCSAERCGDGVRAGSEACDDANATSGDGCSAACDVVEPNFACPDLGGPCTRTSVCGDGILTSDEQCDDRNVASGDGCSATCTSEAGYLCAMVGRPCTAAACGDIILAGSEQCEDGNGAAADGCADCQIESGWACAWESGRSVCHRAVCGDMKVEGNEACDDGNDIVGDGCGPLCLTEPRCEQGEPCRSACGDGLKLASDNEACDDGNARAGDGCGPDCKVERGFRCTDVLGALPEQFELPIVYRDFIRAVSPGVTGVVKHPDFESYWGTNVTPGLVGDMLSGGKPVYTGKCEAGGPNVGETTQCPYGAETTSAESFAQWYANASVPNVMQRFVARLTMNRVEGGGAYRNATFGQQLFPLDSLGWVVTNAPGTTTPIEPTFDAHNYNFTSEIRHWFEFKGGEVLTFSGDDDVWVFINGRLALDLGGLHPKESRTIVLDAATGTAACYRSYQPGAMTPCAENGGQPRALGITPNHVYEMALFHAERATRESNFDLTLTGFIAARSQCVSLCGDGIVSPDEVCDEGSACQGGDNAGRDCAAPAACPGGTCASRNDGSYGHCLPTCQGYGPVCGDGLLQAGEECDRGAGMNRGGYDGCTLECKRGPRCGDSRVDAAYGEQCDLGAGNTGGYDGCSATCRFSERCGDGVVQAEAGELCDQDGNRSPYGGCGPGCKPAPSCGDGVVQRARGEACDDGAMNNDGRYGGCTAQCKRAPRCGDGVVDEAAGETCDDGNLNDFDRCSPQCEAETPI